MSADALVSRATETIEAGSKSFAAAARLFAPEIRESVVMLYAWCRHCDDVVDGQVLGFGRAADAADAPARLADLRRRTAAVFRGEAVDGAAFDAFARVVARHAIPERYALDHLDGFAWDVEGRRYQTLDDLLAYCYRVAGVVGLMMAQVMAATRANALDRACDLGLAFQLTNIARDVVEDAAIARVYLPIAWLADAGIPVDGIAEPRYRAPLAGIAARLVAAAEPYYDSAFFGLSELDLRSALAVATARSVYRAIGTEVVRRGPGAWDERVSTSKGRKLVSLADGVGAALAAASIGRLRDPPPRAGLWTRPA